MGVPRFWMVAVAFVGLWGQLLGPTASARAGEGSPRGCGSWELVYSPNPLAEDILHDVSMVSATDVWAVGLAFDEFAPDRPLLEHWNGATWTDVLTTLPQDTALYGVDALATDDVWAVGQTYFPTLDPFAAHWDGSTWSTVPVPNPGQTSTELLSVDALAPDDVWAVGWHYSSQGIQKPLIEHWDGSSWAAVPSPSTGSGQLSAVSGTSSSDVWAVGVTSDHALVEHWNGSTWSVVRSFRPDEEIALYGVVAISATDAWAVGSRITADRVFAERWTDDGRWHGIGSPHPRNQLNSVAAGSSDDVWMVGARPYESLIEHWDGASLALVPTSGHDEDYLWGVDVLPSGEAWAVGQYFSDFTTRFTETLHFVPC